MRLPLTPTLSPLAGRGSRGEAAAGEGHFLCGAAKTLSRTAGEGGPAAVAVGG
jgi:hypothetical protein